MAEEFLGLIPLTSALISFRLKTANLYLFETFPDIHKRNQDFEVIVIIS